MKKTNKLDFFGKPSFRSGTHNLCVVTCQEFRLIPGVLGLSDCRNQGIDFFVSVVKGQGWPNRTGDAETPHGWLSTMMAGPDGDTFLVQEPAHVFRANTLQ